MVSNVVVALRHAHRSCALSESVRVMLERHQQYRLATAPATASASLLYLANTCGAGDWVKSFVDDTELHNRFEHACTLPHVDKVLTVHPRSWHEAASIKNCELMPYHVHVFVDDLLLMPGTNVDNNDDDQKYLDTVSQKLISWLDEGSLHRGIRSGTHVNITRGLHGDAIAGVMTGGKKEPLGSVV